MRTRLSRTLALSLFLHVGLSAGLWLWPSERPKETELSEPPADLPVTLIETSARSLLRGHKQGAHTKALRNKGGGLRLSEITPSFSEGLRQRALDADADEELSERALVASTWQEPFAYGETPADAAKFAPRASFYEELHRRVDSQILFDDLLAQYNHFGHVYLMFAVEPDGTLIPNSLRAFAADGVLKVRSAWALRKGLKGPVEKNLRLEKPKELWLTARFFWSDDTRCRNLTTVNGPYLTFCRSTQTKPIEKNALGAVGHVATSGLDSLDPTTAYERYKQYKQMDFRRTAQFDPFVKERGDPDYRL